MMDIRELDWMDVAAAFGKMSDREKEILEMIAARLEEDLRARGARFSRSQAMELLAKIGVWMIGANYGCDAVAVVLPASAEE